MAMKKRRILGILSVAALVAMTGCTQTQEGQQMSQSMSESQNQTNESNQKDGIIAYVGTSIFDESLDPVKGAMSYGYAFTNNALLKVNADSEYEGDLATDWSISEDALTYTFNLREDVKFSDGSDFTAEDVVFTYDMVRNNQANNESVDLTYLESVKAVDDYTVEMKLSKAYSPFFDTAAMLQIVPSDGYDSILFDTAPIGTGAYKVIQYDTNQQIILEANEYYFGKTPEIKHITLVDMETDAAFAAAQSGKLDIVMVSAAYAGEEISGMRLEAFETMDVRNISLPVRPQQTMKDAEGNDIVIGNDVTCDLAVRKALSIGLNRETIIENAFNGVGVPAMHFTNNLVWATQEADEDGREEEAKQLLEEAGWVDENQDGIREKDGKECTFEVYAPGSDEDRYRLAVAMAENAKSLGIKVEVKTASWDEVDTLRYTSGVVYGWGQYSPTVLNAHFNSELFLSGGSANVVGLDNAEIDAQIAKAISANNQEDAIAAWQTVQDLANAEYPYLYLVNIEHCYFVNEALDLSLDTQIPHPHGHGSPIICNMADWTWQ